MKKIFFFVFCFFLNLTLYCPRPQIEGSTGEAKIVMRVGHFPNITHAQGVIGHQLTRQEKGWFEERLGPDVEVQWFVYDAGPSAMEGLLINSIDMTYVGPSPAINAYVKSKGKEVRIICGGCSGGVALIVQSDGRIKVDTDFKGKKIGTPQYGNTQDVAARAWLMSIGLHVTQTDGDAFVFPTDVSEQFVLFKQKFLDAIWAVEPWASKFVLEAGGNVYFEESTLWKETKGRYVTVHLVSSVKFLKEHPDLAKKWILAHVELTDWIHKNPDQSKELVNKEIKIETGFSLSQNVLNRAWNNVEFTYDPIPISLFKNARDAYQTGFFKQNPDVKEIYSLTLLDEILKEKEEGHAVQ